MTAITLCIPCRGRSQFLPALLRKLAATRSKCTTIVVVSNGPDQFADPGIEGIHVVHIGNVPTIAVAINFGWYATATPGCILAKIDNDIDPPEDWEREILETSRVASLGGFLCRNVGRPTPLTSVAGRPMRQAHMSQTWGMPFVFGAFTWMAPALAERLQYHDERFIRSSDGDLGERTSRVPGAVVAYAAEATCEHLSPFIEASTEPEQMVRAMYEASDLLIKALPARDVMQPTLWQDCLSREEAARLVSANATLPASIEAEARRRLREKLQAAYAPIGHAKLVERIFREI